MGKEHLDYINRIAKKGELFPPKYAFTLLIPLRNIVLSPKGLIKRLIRPGGVLSISEQAGDPDKISIVEIKHLLKDTEFEFEQVYGSKANFTINFRKK